MLKVESLYKLKKGLGYRPMFFFWQEHELNKCYTKIALEMEG